MTNIRLFNSLEKQDELAALGPHLCMTPGAGWQLPSFGHTLSSFPPSSPHSTLRVPLFEPVPPRMFTWLAQLLGASVLGMSDLHGLFGGKKLGRPSCILRLSYGSQGDAHHKMPWPTTKSWYHQTRRNFWNKGNGHILSQILSNLLRICCLIPQWMDIVPSTIYKMSLGSGARVSMPFNSCVTLG